MRATMGGPQASAAPFIVITAVLDADARPAAVTRAHGEAYDRAIRATKGQTISGLDLVELPIDKAAHAALRKHLGVAEGQAGIYDVFPLSPALQADVRKAAAQFLAAESVWSADANGAFGSTAVAPKLDLPAGWDKDPQAIHQKLIE